MKTSRIFGVGTVACTVVVTRLSGSGQKIFAIALIPLLLLGTVSRTGGHSLGRPGAAGVADDQRSAVLARNAVLPPDPTAKPYFHYFEQFSEVAETFNHREHPNGTRTVQIAGKVLLFDPQDTNHLLARFEGDDDVRRLEIVAEQVIVRTPMRLPGTEVRIHAKALHFEDVGETQSFIDTTPLSNLQRPDFHEDGAHGEKGGDVHVYVQRLHSESDMDRGPRFKMNGGNGQPAGLGMPGANGTDGTRLAVARPDLVSCAKVHGMIERRYLPEFQAYYYVRPDTTLDELEHHAVNGSLPQNGTDAQAGGTPGNPGDAGSFFHSVPNVHHYAEMQAGHTGQPADSYRGGAPGKPDPAIRFWPAACQQYDARGGDGRECQIVEFGCTRRGPQLVIGVERKDILPGNNAPAPSAERPMGTAGTATLVAGNFRYYHPLALSMTIAFAEDAFANDFRQLAHTELEKQDTILTAYEASPEWTALGDEEKTLFTQNALRVRSLLNRLNSQEDYHGNPLGWVPPLSLETSKLLFEHQVEGAIHTIFVADWLTDLNNKQKDKAAALAQAKTLLKIEIAQRERDLNEALERLPTLQVQAVNASTRLEALNRELLIVEAQLTQRAQENVEARHHLPFWKKGLKVLSAVAKAIPVGQPVLTGIGQSLDVIVNFDSEKPWDSVVALPDVVGTFARSDAAEKAKAAQAKKDEAKPEEKVDKASLTETIQQMNQYVGPVVKALKEQKALFASAEVPKDEVTQVLEALKQEDPQFVALTQTTHSILEEREHLSTALTESMACIEQALTQLSEHYLQLAELLPELGDTSAVLLSQRGEVALQDMRQQALHRLTKYQYLLARAFEYRLLQQYPGDLTLAHFFREMQALVAASGDGVLTAADYEPLAALYREELAHIVEQIVNAYNVGVSQNTVPVEYELTAEEQARLNAGEAVPIDFWEKGVFQPTEEDVRIVRLEVAHLDVAVAAGTGGSAYLDVVADHSGEDRIWRNAQVYNFQLYNKETQAPRRWASRWQQGTLTHHQPSASSQSLLRALLTGDDVDLMLFARPSAWATLSLKKVVSGASDAQFDIQQLRLKLMYDYTHAPGGVPWASHRDHQNTVVTAVYTALLHRAPNADELRASRLLLDKGYSTAELQGVVRKVHQEEYLGYKVHDAFTAELDRGPTADERAFWAKELMNGRAEPQMRQYAKLIAEKAAEVFQRLPTYDELALYTKQLDSGLPL